MFLSGLLKLPMHGPRPSSHCWLLPSPLISAFSAPSHQEPNRSSPALNKTGFIRAPACGDLTTWPVSPASLSPWAPLRPGLPSTTSLRMEPVRPHARHPTPASRLQVRGHRVVAARAGPVTLLFRLACGGQPWPAGRRLGIVPSTCPVCLSVGACPFRRPQQGPGVA